MVSGRLALDSERIVPKGREHLADRCDHLETCLEEGVLRGPSTNRVAQTAIRRRSTPSELIASRGLRIARPCRGSAPLPVAVEISKHQC